MWRLCAAGALLATLAGCSSGGGAPAVSSSASSPAQRFSALVQTAKYQQAGLMAYPPSALLADGRRTCSLIAKYGPNARPVETLIREDWQPVAAAALVAAARRTLCP